MATKPLKSIKFPGLDDTYIVPTGTQTVTFEWSGERWSWNRDRYPIEPNTMIIAEFADLYESTDPITAEKATLHYIYDWDGDPYQVIANKSSVPQDFFQAKHAFFYAENNFYLLDMIPAVNNGVNVGVGHTADAHHLYSPGDDSGTPRETPILVGLMESTNKSEKGVEAFVNREKPITANLETGTIVAPGGLTIHQNNPDHGLDSDMFLSIQNEHIRWAGTSNWSDNIGDWYIYNNGTSLEIGENYNNPFGKILKLDYSGSIYTDDGTFETQHGDFVSQHGSVYVPHGNVYASDSSDFARRIPHTYYGTTPPSDSLGVDGDVYIMYSV